MVNRRVFPVLVAFLLAACGGGDGDSPTEPGPPGSPNRPPTATITSPDDGAAFGEGETVTLEGEANDPEDGTLSGSSLIWEDESGSQMGTGETVTMTPPPGEHEITLIAEDSDDATDSDVVTFTVVSGPPTVSLEARLPRPDLDFAGSDLRIADGEAVILRWSTNNEPESCAASGGWSGNLSVSGTDTTSSRPGPAVEELVVRCENAAGAGADTVMVNVAGPGERHAVSNRPDPSGSPKIRFFYMTCEGCVDRELDLDGSLEDAFKQFQDRFESETGRRFRVDTYEGGYDITFVIVDQAKLDQFSVPDAMRKELEERGLFEKGEDSYILYQVYDGSHDGPANGWGYVARSFLRGTTNPRPVTLGHEMVHAHNIVDLDAPNVDNLHHVTDSEVDLMDGTPGTFQNPLEFEVDSDCKDYYCPDGLPDNIRNLAESPFLLPEGS